jgi:hypothetical protein
VDLKSSSGEIEGADERVEAPDWIARHDGGGVLVSFRR